MGSGFARKKKEAKKMEQQFLAMEASLEQKRYVGEAGNGLVSITLNGKCDLIAVQVRPECLDPEEPEVIEDLFRAAFTAAKQALNEDMAMMS